MECPLWMMHVGWTIYRRNNRTLTIRWILNAKFGTLHAFWMPFGISIFISHLYKCPSHFIPYPLLGEIGWCDWVAWRLAGNNECGERSPVMVTPGLGRIHMLKEAGCIDCLTDTNSNKNTPPHFLGAKNFISPRIWLYCHIFFLLHCSTLFLFFRSPHSPCYPVFYF